MIIWLVLRLPNLIRLPPYFAPYHRVCFSSSDNLFPIITATAKSSSTALVDSTDQITSSPTCRSGDKTCMFACNNTCLSKKGNRKCDDLLRSNVCKAHSDAIVLFLIKDDGWCRGMCILDCNAVTFLSGDPQQKTIVYFPKHHTQHTVRMQ